MTGPSTVDIAEGRRLLATATPGPWRVHESGDRLLATAEPTDHLLFATEEAGDAALIVWLRNNAEALLAARPDLDVERLARALAGLGVIENGTWVSFSRADAETIAARYAKEGK